MFRDNEVAFAQSFSSSVILHALKLIEYQRTVPSTGVAVHEGDIVISIPEAFAEALRSEQGKSIFSVRKESLALYEEFLREGISLNDVAEYRAATRPTFGMALDCLRERGVVTDEHHKGWVHVINKNWEISNSRLNGQEKVSRVRGYLLNMVQ